MTPRKFYAADIPASGQPAKKLTPMAAHIEWLKKERKACYELCHDEQMACFDDAINHATALLEAEREYASQQAPASTPPVSANDAALMDVDKPDGVYAVNLSWGINYHPTDLSKVMKAKDCLFIGTGKECADFIYKNKPAPVSAMEDGWVKVETPPKTGKRVLCLCDTGLMRVGYFYKNGWEQDGPYSSFEQDGYTITHWRPLPPPPSK